ncbi:probable leucine-rich repeat receptor-like protein kinase At1g35710 [Cryptomeria japonica]|uniref:probable leucine-rich repeat receptor-like protein kinase At1g35710 n=1 Tax=Cryptomeria japonica TaxID=3369 RepID=UPI0027DA5D38|nr:probable leucine-rich repeat receptor-like protein kinase At1g35710 [Cryptomeria japonica]
MANQLQLLFSIITLSLLRFCCGCTEREAHALHLFKAGLNYSSNVLSSWEKGRDCCLWDGISCDNTTHHVVGVNLTGSDMKGAISESLCTLPSVATIRLSDMGLTGTIPPCFTKLSSLALLDLSGNSLSGNIPPLSNLSSLTSLDLSWNQLTGSLPSSFSNLSSLTTLILYHNKLTGNIPSSFSILSSLTDLDLSENQFTGTIPSSLSNLSSLTHLDLSQNHLNGCIPNSLGNLSSLQVMVLSDNQLTGTLPPSFSRLSSLIALVVDGNPFNQSITLLVLPSTLEQLYISLNGHHIILETLLQSLRKLEILSLSNCVLNTSTTWIPSFQLAMLYMASCKVVDGQIPSWISTQFYLEELEIAESNLVGEIPSWLLDMSLRYINLTTNHLQGHLLLNTSAWKAIKVLDVSNNALCGHIPPIWPPHIQGLFLNDNLLTGSIPPSMQVCSSLQMLNLANNHLNGIIPPSIANCSSLHILNLGDNNLGGMIPSEFGALRQLQSLVIKNNQLSGAFPCSISNCTNLLFLDIGQNLFIGQIPKAIGNLSNLQVLAMRKNKFEGSIPTEIGQLRYLQILDLSSNILSGFIPHSIFSLQAMLIEPQNGFIIFQMYFLSRRTEFIYEDELNMNSKGRDEHYTYIFSKMASIDLSNNQLNGNLPSDIGKLKGLILFNLSMNNFNGTIPDSIVQMSWLESLDLSTNHFSGQIPLGLGSLSYLGALKLSNNNLSGSIPQGGHMATFTKSSYEGNPNLWGCPLPKNCFWPEFSPPHLLISLATNEEEHIEVSLLYWIGVGLSYGVGFGAVVVSIVFTRKWGQKYFDGVDMVLKYLFPWIKNLTI